jgi:hypothetical protein
MLLAAFLTSAVSAQPATITLTSTNGGPLGVSDIRFLLGSDVQFQVFDFETDEDFCLLMGYAHGINGQPSSKRTPDVGFCNVAGRQRLIVMARLVDDQRVFSFGLHDRDTGTGGSSEIAKLPIGSDIRGWAHFPGQQSIQADREATLFRWRFGPNPPNPAAHHDVHIFVRLRENDQRMIGTWFDQ